MDTGWLTFDLHTGSWLNGVNMKTSNNSYGTTVNPNTKHVMYDWDALISAGNVPVGFEARYEIHTDCTWQNDITLELSWDGGSSWTAQKKFAGGTPVSDTIYTLGSSTDLWGFAGWTLAIVNSSTLMRVRIDSGAMKRPACLPMQAAKIYCDMVQLKIYFEPEPAGKPKYQKWTP